MTDNASLPGEEVYRLEVFIDRFVNSEETTPELLRDCLWRLTELLKEVTSSQRRAAAGLLIGVATFELLNRNLVGEAVLLGMKLAKLDFLRIAIPIAAAYLLVRQAALDRDRSVYMAVYFQLTQRAFPGMYKSHMDRLFSHSEGLSFNQVPKIYLHPRGRWVSTAAPIAESTLHTIMVPGFEIYAFWQLFGKEGIGDISVWLALGIVIGLMAVAAAFVRISWYSWLIDDRVYGELYLGNPPESGV